jgi:phosphonate transport system substrate-binding protein
MAAALSPHARAQLDDALDAVRIGLTPVFLDDPTFLRDWRAYLEVQIGRPVRFVQRRSYREIVELIRKGELDFAWLCGYPYVRHRQALRLLALPLFNAKPLYRSYLIVPAGDGTTSSMRDLRGRVFAYSDPDSNSGYLYPVYALIRLGEQSDRFFARSFFTWAHRKVVEAVASGLAQGGAVDGYVWDTLAKHQRALTAQTRVVDRSPEFGFPPFVARRSAADELSALMQRALLGMAEDPGGRALLARLNLDGFTAGQEALFDGIAAMARVVGAADHAPAA